jgi:hypothetical protein
MTTQIERNKQFLTDLFSGPFRGHGLIVRHQPVAESPFGDFLVSDRPGTDWLLWARENYAAQLKLLEVTGHDAVPFLYLTATIGNFAAGFGAKIHKFEGSNAAASPGVFSAEEADRLPQPDIWRMPTVVRWFEMGRAIQETLGRDVPFNVPDIQSPFDIAAIAWSKEDHVFQHGREPRRGETVDGQGAGHGATVPARRDQGVPATQRLPLSARLDSVAVRHRVVRGRGRQHVGGDV